MRDGMAETVEEFDRMFDDGELDAADYIDASTLRGVEADANELKATTITLPRWLFAELDREAARRGTSRQSVMKNWLVDRADEERGKHRAA